MTIVACVVCVVTEKKFLKKNEDWDFFSKLGKNSPNFHWDRGRIEGPKKNLGKYIKHICLLKERSNRFYILWGINKHTRFHLFELVFFTIASAMLIYVSTLPWIPVCF